LLNFNPSFAKNQPCMTPQSQWNSSLSIQWCLLDPFGRITVVGSCLSCLYGTVSDHRNCVDCQSPLLNFNPSFAQNQPCMTPQIQRNSSLSIQWCLLDPFGRIRVVGSCLLCLWVCSGHRNCVDCWLLQHM
jgi:hypothetical protein